MMSLEQKVRQCLEVTPSPVSSPGASILPRFLGYAENIVRTAATWQDDSGRIIDPYEKQETNTLTARYLGALGTQIRLGRCLDLIPSCAAALTPALEDLFNRSTNWGEFIVKEAIMAYVALRGKVPQSQYGRWTRLLSDYDPVTTYAKTRANTIDPESLHNFVTFGIAGEALKQQLGLADNADYVDSAIAQQLTRFDANGMYRDPLAPLVYDITPRMNLSIALWAGYRGAQYAPLSDALMRGGLSQLLYQSSTGEVPFGGRSNQQNFVEVSYAIVCFHEARRWAGLGDWSLAGAYMRAGYLALQAIERYISGQPVFFTKNLFPPELQHGRQRSYGYYGAYSLLIASQIGFACLMADDSIPDGICPAERGGYIFQPAPCFHKIFAACGGIHIEIDTDADFDYDATGLGRVHFSGCLPELCLSTPISATPGYLTCIRPARENLAIGPGWKGRWLAGLNGSSLQASCHVKAETRNRVAFTVTYRHEACTFREAYDLTAGGLMLQVEHGAAGPLDFRMPLLKTNGLDESKIRLLPNGFAVQFKGRVCQTECLTSGVSVRLEDFEAPNRNGIYGVGRFSTMGSCLQFKIGERMMP